MGLFYSRLTEAYETYTKQLRSARSSMKSNSWLMSYVIDGLFGFILFKCSSYILQTPGQKTDKKKIYIYILVRRYAAYLNTHVKLSKGGRGSLKNLMSLSTGAEHKYKY